MIKHLNFLRDKLLVECCFNQKEILMKSIKLLLFSMGVMLLAFTGTANAADLFTPPETDWLVVNVFTPLLDPETSPFGTVSQVFLTGVLMFGGVLAMYTLLVGTMSTAHDGEMLGKRWSTLWVPIRTSLGVAMILPIKNGFCAVQIIIIWLATQGIGLADMAWSAFAAQPMKGAVYRSPGLKYQLAPLYTTIMTNGACVGAANKSLNELKNGEGSTFQNFLYTINRGLNGGKEPSFGISSISKDNSVGFAFGDTNDALPGPGKPSEICGTIELPLNGNEANAGRAVNNAPLSADNLVDMDQIKGMINQTHKEAMGAFVESAYKMGLKIASGSNVTGEEVATQMMSAVNTYENAIMKSANSQFDQAVNVNAIKAMQEDGIAGAGAWFYRLVKAQNEINQEVSNIPVGQGTWSETKKSILGLISSNIEGSIKKAIELGVESFNTSKVGIRSAETEGSIAWFTDFFINSGGIPDWSGNNNMKNNTENPMSATVGIGSAMLTGISLAWAAMIPATYALGVIQGNAVAGLTGAGLGFQATMTLASPLLLGMTAALIMPALFMAYYLPMMPFIIWTGTLIGWLVLVVEALFAGPLWAVAHLAPDADSVVGKQGQGYMLVLSLMLRPILMIIGFIVSLSLMVPCGMFVNYFFAFATYGTTSGVAAIFAGAASAIVYCVIMNNIIKKLLSITHSLPDSILQWIGGGGSRILGEYGGGIESDSRGGQAAALGAAGAAIGARGANAGGGVLGKLRAQGERQGKKQHNLREKENND